jgi:hypothetical protein
MFCPAEAGLFLVGPNKEVGSLCEAEDQISRELSVSMLGGLVERLADFWHDMNIGGTLAS